MRAARILLLAGIALTLVCGGVARAADVPASGVKLTQTQPWRTCTPRMIGYRGQYRVENDLFAGKRGRLCIRSSGDNLTVLTNLPAQPGGVAAAPSIRVGPWYGSTDTQSPFPVSVRAMPRLTDRVNVTGNAAGVWLADTDTYGYTSAQAVTGNPSAELVIATRWHDFPAQGGYPMRIGGRLWYASHWETSGGAQGPHPIIVFAVAHQTAHVWERLSSFVWQARRHGWWPRTARVAGNTCLQLETWSGGRGITLALQVTDPEPVIHPLGGTS